MVDGSNLRTIIVTASAQENEKDSEKELRMLSAYHGLDPAKKSKTRTQTNGRMQNLTWIKQ